MYAKQMLHVLRTCQLGKENGLMAERLPLCMAMIDVIKALALTIMTGEMAHMAWHRFYQRKESRT